MESDLFGQVPSHPEHFQKIVNSITGSDILPDSRKRVRLPIIEGTVIFLVPAEQKNAAAADLDQIFLPVKRIIGGSPIAGTHKNIGFAGLGRIHDRQFGSGHFFDMVIQFRRGEPGRTGGIGGQNDHSSRLSVFDQVGRKSCDRGQRKQKTPKLLQFAPALFTFSHKRLQCFCIHSCYN